MTTAREAMSPLATSRWAWAGLAGCAYFWGHLISALATGDTDDHPVANALTDAVLSLVTLVAVWRMPAGSSPRVRGAIGLVGLVGFLVLSLAPARIDSATAFVPATWLGAAAIATATRFPRGTD
jgi:hypothetical protein